MPHTIESHPPVPLLRDRGVGLAALWLVVVFAFNLTQASTSGQVTGLAVGAPFLASALVDRVDRVVYVGVATVAVTALYSAVEGVPWNASALVRYVAFAVATAFAAWVAHVRLRERRQTVSLSGVARSVQTAVMRLDDAPTARATIGLRYRAADVQALIGGDALEVVDTPWGVRVLVADARGKGLASLRASTLALGAFREWAHEEPDLADLLMRLHVSLARELDDDDFVTALVAQLDDLRFTFASAGHPFPTLVRQQQATELALDAVTTTPLAMQVPHRRPRAASIDLMAGDAVLMVTDGLLEARDRDGRFFPFELAAAAAFTGADVEASIDLLLAAASEHAAGRLSDDIAVAAIRIDDGHRAAEPPRQK